MVRRLLVICLLIFLGFFGIGMLHTSVLQADELVELQKQIDELEKLKQLSEDATKPLEQEVASLESRIASARNGIVRAKQEIVVLQEDIEDREVELALQYEILAERIRKQYKQSKTFSPLLSLLSSDNAGILTKDLAYQSSVKARDSLLIQAIGGDIAKLEQDTQALEERQVQLAALEKQLDEQASFFRVEIAKAKEYQKDLSGQIASLTAKQQAIIAARSGTFTTSVGEVPLADDFNASIGFKAQAPANSFAVFSFGGYTHRNGMSQYGAKARAEQDKV